MLRLILGGVMHTPNMETTPVASMSDLLAQAKLLFDWVFQNLATVVSTILSNPLLLFGFLITLVGLVIGVFKRLSNIG